MAMSGYSCCSFQNLFASELCTTQFINSHPAGHLLSPIEPLVNLDPGCILVPDVVVIAQYIHSPIGHFAKKPPAKKINMNANAIILFCFKYNAELGITIEPLKHALEGYNNLSRVRWLKSDAYTISIQPCGRH